MSGVITNNGKNLILKLLYGDATVSALSQIKIGDGTTTPTIADTDVERELPITSTIIDECDGVGTWSEAGQGKAVSTDTDIYKEGYGTSDNTSLNITKNGGAGVGATWSFDYGSNIVMTSDDLLIWVKIIDATELAKFRTANCLKLYVSTAGIATDFKNWSYDRADLSVGWNLLKIDVSSTADATLGATNIATIRYFRIYYETTNAADTNSDGDVLMDFWHRGTRYTDYMESYVSGYPTYDTSANTVTARAYIPSTQALGYQITEYGEFNTDGTKVMGSHDVVDVLSKDATDEIAVIITHRIRDV